MAVRIPTGDWATDDRMFLWLRDRYLESGSEEDLKDIERLAEQNGNAAYWMSERLSELGDDVGSGEWLQKASDLGCGRAAANLLLGMPEELFDDLEELRRIWKRSYWPNMFLDCGIRDPVPDAEESD